MDYWQHSIYNWGHLLGIFMILLAIFFLLKLLIRVGASIAIFGKAQVGIIHFLEHLMVAFEPISLVILIGVFVMIAPMLHGIIVGLIIVGTISQLRNYCSGRVILYNQTILLGMPLQSRGVRGTVVEMDRLGVQIRSQEGTHYLTYRHLMESGYTIATMAKVGGNYKLSIHHVAKDKKDMHQELYHILRNSPYLESDTAIKIAYDTDATAATVNLAIRNQEHYLDLIQHLENRGFQARILQD